MSAPNSIQYAKTILWHLTKIQAELASTRAEIDLVLSELHPEGTSLEMLQEKKDQTEKSWLRMYGEACRTVGFSAEPPSSTSGTASDVSQN